MHVHVLILTILLTLLPSSVFPSLPVTSPQKYVRAHFNYHPKGDDEIPCQPLGLRFEKGDILEISNQDEPDWWQVYMYIQRVHSRLLV